MIDVRSRCISVKPATPALFIIAVWLLFTLASSASRFFNFISAASRSRRICSFTGLYAMSSLTDTRPAPGRWSGESVAPPALLTPVWRGDCPVIRESEVSSGTGDGGAGGCMYRTCSFVS